MVVIHWLIQKYKHKNVNPNIYIHTNIYVCGKIFLPFQFISLSRIFLDICVAKYLTSVIEIPQTIYKIQNNKSM